MTAKNQNPENMFVSNLAVMMAREPEEAVWELFDYLEGSPDNRELAELVLAVADTLTGKKEAAEVAERITLIPAIGARQYARANRRMWSYVDAIENKAEAAEFARSIMARSDKGTSRCRTAKRKMWHYVDAYKDKGKAAEFAYDLLKASSGRSSEAHEIARRLLAYTDQIASRDVAAGPIHHTMKLWPNSCGVRDLMTEKLLTCADGMINRSQAAIMTRDILLLESGYRRSAYGDLISKKMWGHVAAVQDMRWAGNFARNTVRTYPDSTFDNPEKGRDRDVAIGDLYLCAENICENRHPSLAVKFMQAVISGWPERGHNYNRLRRWSAGFDDKAQKAKSLVEPRKPEALSPAHIKQLRAALG